MIIINVNYVMKYAVHAKEIKKIAPHVASMDSEMKKMNANCVIILVKVVH